MREAGFVQRRADKPSNDHSQLRGLFPEHLLSAGSHAQDAMDTVGHQRDGDKPPEPGLLEGLQAVGSVGGEVRNDDAMPQPDNFFGETMFHIHGGELRPHLRRQPPLRRQLRTPRSFERLYPAALYLHDLGECIQGHVDKLSWLVGQGKRLVDVADGRKNIFVDIQPLGKTGLPLIIPNSEVKKVVPGPDSLTLVAREILTKLPFRIMMPN